MFHWFLLSAADLGKAFTNYSKRSSSLSDNWFIFAAFAAIAVFWVVLFYWDKYRQKLVRRGQNPKTLFVELCRAHSLNRVERSLLSRIAEAKQLSMPSLLFVDPHILQNVAANTRSNSKEIRLLAKKMFGTPDPV